MYVDTRTEDLMELRQPITTENGIQIVDTLRFFKGDGPSAQFEAGQQKGGGYFCWSCEVNADRCDDLAQFITGRQENKSIEKVAKQNAIWDQERPFQLGNDFSSSL